MNLNTASSRQSWKWMSGYLNQIKLSSYSLLSEISTIKSRISKKSVIQSKQKSMASGQKLSSQLSSKMSLLRHSLRLISSRHLTTFTRGRNSKQTWQIWEIDLWILQIPRICSKDTTTIRISLSMDWRNSLNKSGRLSKRMKIWISQIRNCKHLK